MSLPAQSSLLGLVSSFLADNDDAADDEVQGSIPSTNAKDDANVDLDEGEGIHQVPRVSIVIFSKDRPWQLQELFRSMCLHDQVSESADNDGITISLQLLVNITETFENAYQEVMSSFEKMLDSVPSVSLTCHKEDATTCGASFQSLFEGIVDRGDKPSHWMFLTDDCLLLVPLYRLLNTATLAFQSNPDVKCFLSRLHPGITWTQTRSLPSPPPRTSLRYHPAVSTYSLRVDGFYLYPLERGELDWAYPWDLSGGIYTHSFVQTLLAKLKGTPDGLSHPNRMEIAGNQSISAMNTSNFQVSIPTCPMLLILAINRVQNVCRAPLACQESQASTWSAQALLSFYNEKKRLDIARYKALHFGSSHVGELYLPGDVVDGNESESRPGYKPALSVLIPVHTGPPHAAMHAIRSIVMQQVDEFTEYRSLAKESFVNTFKDSAELCLSPMQIVLVDDRCVDGSIDVMMDVVQNIATEHQYLCTTIKDHRREQSSDFGGAAATSCASTGPGIELFVEIVSSPAPGVAVALNHGLSYCLSEFVARMDADDVAHPGRLQAQLTALKYQPNVNVIGTFALIFREGDVTMRNDNQRFNSTDMSPSALPYSPAGYTEASTLTVSTSIPPTDAGFAAWAMIFSCSIAHPSVVFRRKSVAAIGGYNETICSAEDYDLWLRMTMENCSSLLSIPRIGLWHRKHGSRSYQRISKQANEALQASTDAVKILLRSDLKWSKDSMLTPLLSVLRNRATAASLSQVNEAVELLTTIEDAFMRHHTAALTSREVALIRKDCSERIGELVTLAIHRSLLAPADVNSSVAWKVWCERCPELFMNRVALLCHNYLDQESPETTSL